MIYLLAVSLLWGFSFGLVKAEFSALSGSTLALMRLLIALPCFIPFLKPAFREANRFTFKLLAIGGVQFGLMYVCLFSSFTYLSGYEVALLTIFTPLYVVLADALLERRYPPAWFWYTSLLAVTGALWIFQPHALPHKWPGILLMQGANICFASGQVAYRRVRHQLRGISDLDFYALLYLGGVVFTLPFAMPVHPLQELTQLSLYHQWLALVYLGAIASGLGFFLWNKGAAQVNPATLAVFNNLKIPIATLISITVFGEEAALGRLIPGLIIMLAALAWAEWAHRRLPTNRN